MVKLFLMWTKSLILLGLVLFSHADVDFGGSWLLNPIEVESVKNRFVEYTFRVDRVLSGNISNSALNSLMDMFSANFQTWNTELIPDADPTPPVPPVVLPGGVSGKQALRQKYVEIATQQYTNYSIHMLLSIQTSLVGWSSFSSIYNTKAYLLEYATMKIFDPQGSGVLIQGQYNCDWIREADGKFRMRRFYTNTRKISPFAFSNGAAVF